MCEGSAFLPPLSVPTAGALAFATFTLILCKCALMQLRHQPELFQGSGIRGIPMKDSAHLPLSCKLILDSCLVDWSLSDVQGGREVSGIWLSGRRFVHSSTETREHLTYTGFCNSRVEIIGYDDHIPDI